MRKKLCMMAVVLICILSGAYAYYNVNMNAAGKGVMTIQTRDSAAAGYQFVFGSFEGKDVIMEAIKTQANGDILAMEYGGHIRLGLCNSPTCPQSVPYSDTTLFLVENEINAGLSQSARNGINGDVFIPTYDDLKDGGNLQLTLLLRQDASIVRYAQGEGVQPTFYWRGIPMTYTYAQKAIYLKAPVYNTINGYIELPSYGGGEGIPRPAGADITPHSGACLLNTGMTGTGVKSSCDAPGAVQRAYVIRPALILIKEKVLFALDTSTNGSALTQIDPADPSVLLKLRILDSSVSRIHVSNQNKSFAKGDKIKIPYSGGDTSKHISALFLNASGQMIYYQNFANQPASGTLEIDTANLPPGKLYH